MGGQRNPDLDPEEHILALDLYMRLRGTAYGEDHPEVIQLSETLRALARLRGMSGGPTFRNPNGVSMEMMNFRRLDPDYTVDGRVGLNRGSSQEESVWRDFADDPPALKAAVAGIMDEIDAAIQEELDGGSATELREDGEPDANEERYWVFVCNPAKWAIDRFLAGGITEDTWSVRPSDRDKFAPGQLAIVRVGVDRRSQADRDGHPPLEPGIYALCEVESEAFPASGADDSFWAEGEAREPGWPTVRIRYLRGYLQSPLTIERLRAEHPDLSHLLLDGFRAASFPISADDFRVVVRMLGEDLDDLPAPPPAPADTGDELAALEKKYLHASPEVKTKVGKHIERGPVGAAVKKATGYKCQLCEAMGRDPIGFLKPSGEPYVEAHHVMPVSTLQIGSLAASNIMTLCPNHHRQVHYGGVSVVIGDESFSVTIGGTTYTLPKTISLRRTSCGGGRMNDPYETGRQFGELFGRFEHVLKRSDYLKKGRLDAQADRDRFAGDLGQTFFDEVSTSGIGSTLINDPPRKLMADGLTWQPAELEPLSDVVALFVRGVCRVRNSYMHGEKFTGGPDGSQWERDAMLLSDALAVLELAGERSPPSIRAVLCAAGR